MNVKFYMQYAVAAVAAFAIIAIVDVSGMLATKAGVLQLIALIFLVTLLAVCQRIRVTKARFARVIARAKARYEALPFRQQLLAPYHAPAWEAACTRRITPAVEMGGVALLNLVVVLIAAVF